ncbi:MAG TPA: response regulator transcription factor [Bacillota bacterium]|nr:response regulator transcription factor [Bacillota bacterium]HOK69715.1 response regulator transcription factor [Bacillota bacterium]HPP85575.1 response regulator transcription factor [Bacillota bacterium]
MKVLVIDDDKLICASLKTILESDKEITVVGLGNSGKEAVELFYKTQPDVLLLDIRMGEMSGLDAAEAVLKMQKDAKVLFLTTFADDEYIIKALKIGARGYILKQNFESIVPAVKAVNIGQYVFGEDIVAKLPELLNKSGKNSFESYGISDKEQEIISLVAEGLNNKEIAAKLYLSEGTVRNYLSAILDKLNLRDRTQLAVFYFKNK